MDAKDESPSYAVSTQIVALILAVGFCVAVGVVGAVFTTPKIPTWYAGLEKPSWTPPNYLFGPVWTTLYILMGIAAWLVWRGGSWTATRAALTAFAVQLTLNAIWSPLFFGLESPLVGLIVIVLLWLMIGVTIYGFARRATLAALLLVPYFLWVSYASCLNFAIWRLNG
ncbi:tryptophan-rich sensory protein [Blastopirellula sp. JC732]|uniref:Tryptophan-rich sensory protein n=1 Tax=Blastopirellula sediminis TaxID=2894196 RepID=A0A9X1MSW0_9BACT|nr:TspO/MBR family protein [Blastopirellula sediminis]MCC9605706.1 tryptophan-rich sensory protein [Blastopirellula sediminis]MCC9630994.1 tryptophan-rich sensory protein [Blastopirellula sediminis]